jgi:thiamine biosynthesis lipoprotein
MGSTISWWARTESGAQVAAWFEVVEDCCSRFNPDSKLSGFNRDPREEVPVSALLGEVLEAGDRAYSLSRGLVDPTVLKAAAATGYDRDFSPARRRPVATPGRVEGWDRVRVQGNRIVRPPGVGIDLGGIAKGWPGKGALELIDGPALVDAVSDIAVRGPWMIDVQHMGELVARLLVQDLRVATSGIDRRAWPGGHHLIDPRSRLPALTDVVAATVAAEDTPTAETVARTVFLMGHSATVWPGRNRSTRSRPLLS